jgi:energy-coupling factor transporter ATP-binding protein EcfA2
MIDRVQFENFKSLQNVTLALGRLTVLVGTNGCGKTSVLQGLHLLSRTGRDLPKDRDHGADWVAAIFGGPNEPRRLMHRPGAGKLVLAMRSIDGDELRVAIRVTETDVELPSGAAFEVGVGPTDPIHGTLPLYESSPNGAWTKVRAVLAHPRVHRFGSAAYLHLNANEMVRTTVVEDEIPRMEPDGSGLASVLAWMKGATEDDLARITADLREVVPGVKRIRTLRERLTHRRIEKMEIDGQPIWRPVDKSQIGDRFEIEFDDGSEIPADLLSEGTILALGLLTRLRQPQRPRLILVDDIDRGLHLAAQTKLVEALRTLMKLDPELQIICTTHSPYLLDLFEPAEVRVLALDAERRTHARPLTEHPDFAKWKFGTQTGELWAALGEAWVVDGANG